MSPKSSSSCLICSELDPILDSIRKRFAELTDVQCQRKVFLKRLQGLTRFGAEPMDYVTPENPELPKELEIGYAVCHPECGNQAYIVVEGGPQTCDSCGGTMMPTEMAIYRKKK